MAHYIYKFLNTDEQVIYVGITSNLKARIRAQHFTGNGHLPMECYKQTSMVLYSECASCTDAKIKELYLINKLSPLFNQKLNNGDVIPWPIADFDWKYIGFDNESVHTVTKGTRKRIGTDSESLKQIFGSEVQYDLSSAVHPSPLPGTVWLDAVAVEKTGLSWGRHGPEICSSYADMTIEDRVVSFSSCIHKRDKETPIGKFIMRVSDEFRQPESKRNPVIWLHGLTCKRWIVVPAEFNPSDVRVRLYTEAEDLALALTERLDPFRKSIATTDGWTVVAASDDDFPISSHLSFINSKEYGDICELLGPHPAYTLYENGKFQHGHHIELANTYSKEFDQYQRQLNAAAGIYVYATNELTAYIAKHKKLIRQLVDSLPRSPLLLRAANKSEST